MAAPPLLCLKPTEKRESASELENRQTDGDGVHPHVVAFHFMGVWFAVRNNDEGAGGKHEKYPKHRSSAPGD